MAKSMKLKKVERHNIQVRLRELLERQSADWVDDLSEVRVVRTTPVAIKVLRADDERIYRLNKRLRGEVAAVESAYALAGEPSSD